MDRDPNLVPGQASNTYFWLLVSLLVSLLILPLLEGLHLGRPLMLAGLTSTFIVGAMAAHSSQRTAVFVLLIVALPTAWATLFVDSTPLFVTHCVFGSSFFWMVGGLTVYRVVRTHRVTFESVFGAIGAFLLFGLAWGLSYWAIHTVTPDAFSFPVKSEPGRGADLKSPRDFSQFVYYSFVAMTTLGYGDITPLGRVARTLSWMQSVVGQFYVAVVIAWLVSALPRPGNER